MQKNPEKATLVADQYETEYWAKKTIISGIDEVGRGCLAGPVVTCALILHSHCKHPLLLDSKILTENQRTLAAQWISQNSWYSFGIVDHKTIDQKNIYQATLIAMKRAYYGLLTVNNLPQEPSLVLVDAMPLSLPNQKVTFFTKGESKSISIAAASIMAKVMRDNLMKRLEKDFPGYDLNKNKGYGAQKHRDQLLKKGPSLIHRDTFISSFKQGSNHEEKNQQTSLFC